MAFCVKPNARSNTDQIIEPGAGPHTSKKRRSNTTKPTTTKKNQNQPTTHEPHRSNQTHQEQHTSNRTAEPEQQPNNTRRSKTTDREQHPTNSGQSNTTPTTNRQKKHNTHTKHTPATHTKQPQHTTTHQTPNTPRNQPPQRNTRRELNYNATATAEAIKIRPTLHQKAPETQQTRSRRTEKQQVQPHRRCKCDTHNGESGTTQREAGAKAGGRINKATKSTKQLQKTHKNHRKSNDEAMFPNRNLR